MKFKSPTDTPVYVPSTTSVCAWVGPTYRELPAVLHREALIRGCITDNMTAESIAEQSASEPGRIDGLGERIAEQLREIMVRGDVGDFTKAGLPDLEKLSKRCGFTVTRTDMLAQWKALKALVSEKVEVA